MDAVTDLGREEAATTVAFLAGVLPDALRPVFGPAFIRSHVLYGEFVCRLALRVGREIGLDRALREPGDAAAVAARAGLAAAQARVPLDWLLRFLAARGHLGRLDEGAAPPRYQARAALAAPDPEPVRAEQTRHDPSWQPAYALAETVAADYPAFLRGEVAGEHVLFAPRRLRLWVDYFSNDNGLYAVNNQVAAVAGAACVPDAGGVVLELGGGLGSGAVALLDRLEATGRLGAIHGYRFTELVPAFLRRGEQALRTRHPALPGLTAAGLDMNRPFAEQGVAAGSIALVYAVNTVHAAHDLAFTLGEARRALAPGGRLVLSECVRPAEPIYADFVFNLAETFRSPRLHPAYRPHGGFLSPAHWAAALAAAGFADVRFVPDIERVRAGVPDFAVAAITAARPAA